MTRPETKYALAGDTHIAYQTLGQGSPDVVYVPNWFTNVEGRSEVPVFNRVTQRLASFSRLMSFDQPGTGHSDPVDVGRLPALEEFADSIRTVLDDAGVERAGLFAYDAATFPAIMFAATHPERTSALVIHNGTARWMADGDYPGIPPDLADIALEGFAEWGTPAYAAQVFPSMAGDDEACEALARYWRGAVSPGMVRPLRGMILSFDVRPLLSLVSCPTLVFCTTGRSVAFVEHTRYIAEHIPHAKMVEVDSADQVPYDEIVFDRWMNEIQEFLTGERPSPRLDEDRVLATVLYTDFVESTKRSVEKGDHAWRELLDKHDAIVRRLIEGHRGRWVKHTGDGVLATFDGPARAVRCACAIRDSVRSLGIETRSGLHTGEVEIRADDYSGIAMNVGSRVMNLATAGEVLVSSTVVDLVAGSGLEFVDRGEHEFKGVPRPWRIYAVVG